MEQVNRLLDLATDPHLDMASQFQRLKDELDRQKLKSKKLYLDLAALDAKLMQSQEENKRLRKELNRLNRKLEDPVIYEAVLTAYSDQASIERHKPGEGNKHR